MIIQEERINYPSLRDSTPIYWQNAYTTDEKRCHSGGSKATRNPLYQWNPPLPIANGIVGMTSYA